MWIVSDMQLATILLESHKGKNGFYIINLNDIHNLGNRWVVVNINQKGSQSIIEYFDSFGMSSPQ